MMRSRRQAGNGLFSGYKKAEEVARKKVVIEFEAIEMLRKFLHCHNNKEFGPKGNGSRLKAQGKNNKRKLILSLCLVPQTSFAGKAIEQGAPRLPLPLPKVLG
jgi:hypothetical protein